MQSIDDAALLTLAEDVVLCCHIEKHSCPDEEEQIKRGSEYKYEFLHMHMPPAALIDLRKQHFRPAFVMDLSQSGAVCRNARDPDVCAGIYSLVSADTTLRTAREALKADQEAARAAKKAGEGAETLMSALEEEERTAEPDLKADSAYDVSSDPEDVTTVLRRRAKMRLIQNAFTAAEATLGALLGVTQGLTDTQKTTLEETRHNLYVAARMALEKDDPDMQTPACREAVRLLKAINLTYAQVLQQRRAHDKAQHAAELRKLMYKMKV